MKKNYFLVDINVADKIEEFSDAQKGKLFMALIDYNKTGKIPEIDDPKVCIVFGTLLPGMDFNNNRWEEISRKRSEAGKKGGAPKGNQNARKKPVELPKKETPKFGQLSPEQMNTILQSCRTDINQMDYDFLDYDDSFRQVEQPTTRRGMSSSNHLGFDGVEEVYVI